MYLKHIYTESCVTTPLAWSAGKKMMATRVYTHKNTQLSAEMATISDKYFKLAWESCICGYHIMI